MKVQIHTRLKEGVLDPQGKAVESALKNLGYKEINKIRQGKLFDIDIDTTDNYLIYDNQGINNLSKTNNWNKCLDKPVESIKNKYKLYNIPLSFLKSGF